MMVQRCTECLLTQQNSCDGNKPFKHSDCHVVEFTWLFIAPGHVFFFWVTISSWTCLPWHATRCLFLKLVLTVLLRLRHHCFLILVTFCCNLLLQFHLLFFPPLLRLYEHNVSLNDPTTFKEQERWRRRSKVLRRLVQPLCYFLVRQTLKRDKDRSVVGVGILKEKWKKGNVAYKVNLESKKEKGRIKNNPRSANCIKVTLERGISAPRQLTETFPLNTAKGNWQ